MYNGFLIFSHIGIGTYHDEDQKSAHIWGFKLLENMWSLNYLELFINLRILKVKSINIIGFIPQSTLLIQPHPNCLHSIENVKFSEILILKFSDTANNLHS
jgi:hypothetical protein